MSNQKDQENGSGGTPESAAEFSMDFQPETEDQLIGLAKWLRSGEQVSLINSRWVLGDRINRSNETVYGENTIGKIAAEADYSLSTINKCRRFAEKYSVEQKTSLLSGSFILSWRDIAQNLTIDPVDLIRVYNESSDKDEFRSAVTKFKDPDDVKFKRLHTHKKGRINREYRILMENQVEYRDFQLKMKKVEISDLKGRMAKLKDKLALYEEKASGGDTIDQIDYHMDQKLAAMAA